jgi:tRNA-splicing ligase RtcB
MRHGRETLRDSLPDALEQVPLSDSRLDKIKHRDGRVQFGTLGRGNHFLEFQKDQDGALWLMVHSGSRGIGQAISQHHLGKAASASNGLHYFDAESEAGMAYLADHRWACCYAEMSRRAMLEAVAALVEQLFAVPADWSSTVHCNHNHVRRETHFGNELWVHRKGAVSAHIDEPGIIPGSMGTASFHVEGRGLEDSLCSSSHGAGRRMSRGQAFKAITMGDLVRQMKGIWFDHRWADRLRDEAPLAYKDIHAVMRAQHDLTRIVRQLWPVLNYKGV